MKKVLVIIGLCALAGYLVFAAFYFNAKPEEEVCTHFEVEVNNTENDNLIGADEIEKYINAKGLNPYGKLIKDINTYNIEQAITSNKLVKSAEVFVTSNGGIKAVVKNRRPLFRVVDNSGDSYYIDKDADRMPLAKDFTADLPVVTGVVKEEFAKTDLYIFVKYLLDDDFWDAQIEQIVVLPENEIKLIPRVGNHEIILGKLENYKDKLDRLKVFYEKGLKQVGWNRYSVINLKYNKQVVCTKD